MRVTVNGQRAELSLHRKVDINRWNSTACMVSGTNEETKATNQYISFWRQQTYEAQEEFTRHNVAVFSSNYTLYGDMSNRVMSTLRGFTPNLEVYSIDKAFLDFSGFEAIGMLDHATTMRKVVFQNTGIPVSVGIAPS